MKKIIRVFEILLMLTIAAVVAVTQEVVEKLEQIKHSNS